MYPMCAFSMCRNCLHLMHLRIDSNGVEKTGRYVRRNKRQKDGNEGLGKKENEQ